ncbi:hypothetical protein Q8A67_020282 [Cirrhinus molitorella]|uniref:Uncharacterized protein n=1 Tax=Cirrhinus molitorella TaxID=172907 RepID=A0AA88TGT9_9TELE|nr:hypothetical protein Q8A67_020282 [Cirrhinus molitorella]
MLAEADLHTPEALQPVLIYRTVITLKLLRASSEEEMLHFNYAFSPASVTAAEERLPAFRSLDPCSVTADPQQGKRCYVEADGF